jgi:DNA-binding response OmpR family regulator
VTTLLAVDDSTTMRKVLEITFAGEPFETLLAGSAEDAMIKLDERRPEIALIDATLGDRDGYELCRQVKTEFSGVRVLILSSKQNPYDAARGNEAGADDHIDKPFETQALIDKVKALASMAPAAQPAVAARATARPTPPPSSLPVASPDDVPVVLSDPAPQLSSVAPVTLEPASVSAAPRPRPSSVPAVETPSLQSAAVVGAPPSSARSNGKHSMETKLEELGLNRDQVQAVLTLSKEVIERAVWEVVPTLAETLIKEEIERLTRE